MLELRLALVGYGTVTKSLVELLVNERQHLYRDHGLVFHIVAAADSKGIVVSRDPIPAAKLSVVKMDTGSVAYYPGLGQKGITGLEAIELCDADILVETTPTDLKTAEPGLTNIRVALAKGMHVVTANKGPLALHWGELQSLAARKGLQLRYGAAASAALPVLEMGRSLAEGGELLAFEGVFNATSGFVLNQMEQGLSMADAVKEAQRRGFAEADPSLDLGGWDTAVKLLIMANHFWRRAETIKDVQVMGVGAITPQEIRSAMAEGKMIRLMGRGSVESGQLRLSVHPEALDIAHPLASIRPTDKGIVMTTRHLGEQVHLSLGPRQASTAGTMLADLIQIGHGLSKEGC